MRDTLLALRNLWMHALGLHRWHHHGMDAGFIWRRWNNGRWEYKEMGAAEAEEALHWWATK